MLWFLFLLFVPFLVNATPTLVNYQAANLVFIQSTFTSTTRYSPYYIFGITGAVAYANNKLYVGGVAIGDYITVYDPLPVSNGGSVSYTVSLSTSVAPLYMGSNGSNLVVSDTNNHCVLVWFTAPGASQANNIILGISDTNLHAIGPSTFNYPNGIAFGNGATMISDTLWNRVLVWQRQPTQNNQNADIVLGQSDFVSSSSGCSRSTLNNPTGISSDGGSIAVVDASNYRVLVWKTLPTATNTLPDVVLGQPNFTTCANTGPSQTAFIQPNDVKIIGNRIFVADYNRVLIWTNYVGLTNGAPADIVWGQTDFNSASFPGYTSQTFWATQIQLVSSTQVLVSDKNGYRILSFNIPASPTLAPTPPTMSPSKNPTLPTLSPTSRPSISPTLPTAYPTKVPTKVPSKTPSTTPTTSKPSISPSTSKPSKTPSRTPTSQPSRTPSRTPSTSRPSRSPTLHRDQYGTVRLYWGATSVAGNLGSRTTTTQTCVNAATALSLFCTYSYAILGYSGDSFAGTPTFAPVPGTGFSFNSQMVVYQGNTVVAPSWRSLWTTGLSVAFPDYQSFWSGLDANGAYNAHGTSSCGGWTIGTFDVGQGSQNMGPYGYAISNGTGWSYQGVQTCDTPLSMLCACVYVPPTSSPTTSSPSRSPTSSVPTRAPSRTPTTTKPSRAPSSTPTRTPTTSVPTRAPVTSKPTQTPTTKRPSQAPTSSRPSYSPTTSTPTLSPTNSPTYNIFEKTNIASSVMTGSVVSGFIVPTVIVLMVLFLM